jgi:hypothetical protein
MVRGQPGQKVHENPFQPIKSRAQGCTPDILAMGSINRKIMVQTSPDIRQNLI